MVFSAACLAAIFLFIDPAEVLAALRTAQYGYLAYTGLGIVVFLLVRAVRWRFLLRNEPGYVQTLHIQNIGYMLTMVLPFRIGDVARAILIGNVPPTTVAQGVSTMVVERLFDMLFIVTLLPFTLAQVETLPEWMRSGMLLTGGAAVFGIGVLIVAANKRPLAQRVATAILDRIRWLNTETWTAQLDNLLAGLDSLTRLRDGSILIGLTILTWLPIVLAYYAALFAVGISGTLPMAGFVVCAAALSVAAPSSPGQVGVFHAGVFAALHGVLGQPETAAFNYALLYHALNLLLMVLLGFVGIAGTGTTFGKVVTTTQAFLQRRG